MEHSTGTVTVQALESKTGTPYKNPGDVEFEVKYPDGYTGPRLMPEGPVTVSQESAVQFEKLGIGAVLTPHTITEEDLENNPGLKGEVAVGEEVLLGPQLSAEEVAQLEAETEEVKSEETPSEPTPEEAKTEEPKEEEPVAPPAKESKKKGK